MQFFFALILFFGFVNVIRMFSLFCASFWYDITKIITHPRLTYYKPWVTVIITAFNEEKVIERSLTSVYESEYTKLRIIVANDGSTDKTVSTVKRFIRSHPERKHRISIISRKNGGKATIINTVLRKYVSTPLVMVLDADSRLSADALNHATQYFRERNVVALAANVRIMKHPQLLGLIQYIEYLMGHQLKKAYTAVNNEYIIGGIGSMFRVSTLKKVGLFDTNTLTEDIDLSMKIIARGNKRNKVIFASDVICFTEPVDSLYGLFRQRFRWKFGRLQAIAKQKNLLFNSDAKYTKLLTFVQLPFVVYSELTFLLDPLFLSCIIYFLFKYQDFQTIQSIFFFFGFYTAAALISDQYTTFREKIILTCIAPLSYVLFLMISIVEYLTLLKCLSQISHIFDHQSNRCSWIPVQRIG